MKRVITLNAVALIIILSSCGAPLDPAPWPWQTLVSYEGGRFSIESLAVDGDAVYFPVNWKEGGNIISRYDNGQVEDVFELEPEGAHAAVINDIAIANGAGWAVGYRTFPAGGDWNYKPFLIEYDGAEWREVDISGLLPNGVPSGITPIDNASFWFLLQERPLGEREPWGLWKCERGRFSEYPMIKGFKNNSHYELAVAYDLSSGVTYAAVAAKEECELFISEDRGGNWVKETAKLNIHNTKAYPNSITLAAAGGVLYLASHNYEWAGEVNEYRYSGGAVHRRTGAAGCGEYELLLSCPLGPNFGRIERVAADPGGRILAVGRWTSAFYDGARWVQEELPARNDINDVAVGVNGFYAVGSDWNHIIEILHHP